MKTKVLFSLMMSFILLTSVLMATEARMAGLGNPYGFVRDYTDIFVFPNHIYHYSSQAVAELNNPFNNQGWTMGVNLPVNDNVFGLYLNKPTGINLNNYLFAHSDYNFNDLDISRKIQMLFGFKETFGVSFGMAVDSYSEPVTASDDLEMGAFLFDIIGSMTKDNLDLALNFQMAVGGVLNDNSQEELTASYMKLGLMGRYFLRDDDRLTTMAILGFGMNMRDQEHTPVGGGASTETSEMDMIVDLGAGVNYHFNPNNTLVLAVKPIRFVTETDEAANDDKTTDTMMYVPEYFIGLESVVNSWLTGRIGARQSYVFGSSKFEPSGGGSVETAEYDSAFDINLGVAFKFGNFTIDTILQNDFLFNGPDFIGGNANGIASHLSVTYNF